MRLTSALLALPIALTIVLAAQTALAGSLESRIESVGNLLTVSSAARKIDSSTSVEAKRLLEEARGAHRRAADASAAGNADVAKVELEHAVKTLFTAARLADGGAAIADKKKQDYDARKESIGALLDALERVAEEKSVPDQAAAIHADVAVLIGRAEVEYGASRYAAGREILDQAYVELKTAIEKLRGGDTLVMELNFANKEEEYRYFEKKIASQHQAIGVFADRIEEPMKKKMIHNLLEKAHETQTEAEGLASAGKFEEAIPLMESVLRRLQSGLMMVAR